MIALSLARIEDPHLGFLLGEPDFCDLCYTLKKPLAIVFPNARKPADLPLGVWPLVIGAYAGICHYDAQLEANLTGRGMSTQDYYKQHTIEADIIGMVSVLQEIAALFPTKEN